MQYPGDGGRTAAQLPADVSDRAPLEVVQHHGLALSLGQSVERSGQVDGLFIALGLLARRRLLRRQPGVEPGRLGIEGRFQPVLAGHGALVPAEVAHRMGQVPPQDLPQPGRALAVVLAAELVAGLVGLQQRLLHDV